MFQKGPGEGYQAAKSDAQTINPNLRCRLSNNGGITHYRILDGNVDVGCGAASAREAWNKILCRYERQSRA